MFAVIQTGGRQVKVVPGTVVNVDRLAAQAGQEVHFERVLLVGRDGGDVVAGSPFVAGTRVVATVQGEARGPKLRVFRKKRRKGYRRTLGHRTTVTRVEILDIVSDGNG